MVSPNMAAVSVFAPPSCLVSLILFMQVHAARRTQNSLCIDTLQLRMLWDL